MLPIFLFPSFISLLDPMLLTQNLPWHNLNCCVKLSHAIAGLPGVCPRNSGSTEGRGVIGLDPTGEPLRVRAKLGNVLETSQTPTAEASSPI